MHGNPCPSMSYHFSAAFLEGSNDFFSNICAAMMLKLTVCGHELSRKQKTLFNERQSIEIPSLRIRGCLMLILTSDSFQLLMEIVNNHCLTHTLYRGGFLRHFSCFCYSLNIVKVIALWRKLSFLFHAVIHSKADRRSDIPKEKRRRADTTEHMKTVPQEDYTHPTSDEGGWGGSSWRGLQHITGQKWNTRG